MIRGTRYLIGKQADAYNLIIDKTKSLLKANGFGEIILPSIWEQETFVKKAGQEILGQMYTFKDKGDRDICLIPEVTALVQELYNESWKKNMPKPIRIFYVQKCYRYERPQEGRYREFTQLGVEILGGKSPDDREEAIKFLKFSISQLGVPYEFKDSVKRGLDYYVEDGFEVEIPTLGAQKQVAGGGRYAEGIGWAIGVDRLMIPILKKGEME
jgi:histidyl-tRNA synthetase